MFFADFQFDMNSYGNWTHLQKLAKSISKSTTNIQSNFNMQVEKDIQNRSSPPDSENSPVKETIEGNEKQVRAQNRIARYEQKPQRKASKMLVRLLQWADKLVIKFFTKKLLPNQLQIFFNRQARANKVQLKKAQIDYSVQDFAVRLYVFWVCQTYFQKISYEESLEKLLLELRDELTRKKTNLGESLQSCEGQTQKKQKQEELKWMAAIINGLNSFVHRYTQLATQDQIMQFLLEITGSIMIDCLRKPGNKLSKKKEKLKIKIKYFQEKIAEILGNHQQRTLHQDKQKQIIRVVHKNTIIISSGHNPFEGLTRTTNNSSAFQKYKVDQQAKVNKQTVKKQDFQVRLQYQKRDETSCKQQLNIQKQNQKSNVEINILGQVISQSQPISDVKMEEEAIVNQNINLNSQFENTN